jgi:hypothetical protein
MVPAGTGPAMRIGREVNHQGSLRRHFFGIRRALAGDSDFRKPMA